MQNSQDNSDNSFKEITQFFENLGFHRIKPGLYRVTQILKHFGNPHKNLKVIHIAGTNGKGSTAIIMEKLLRGLGLKTGLFTSPHLFSIRERFLINGNPIPEKILLDYLNFIKNRASEINATFFEVITGVALKYFFDEKVDIAIIECGLGGRLDSTNVVAPLLSIITSIGFDHMKYLGNTLEEIAKEKAGIIKRGRPIILGKIEKKPFQVIKEIAYKKESPFWVYGGDFFIKGKKFLSESLKISVKTFPLIDVDFEKINLALSLKAIEVLKNSGFSLYVEKIPFLLSKVKLPGRFDIKKLGSKTLIFDVAHNPDGIKALKKVLKKKGLKGFILILGATNTDGNKPFLRMLEELAEFSKEIWLTEFEVKGRKVVTCEEWRKGIENFKKHKKEIFFRFFSSPEGAFHEVEKSRERLFLITGSFYLVAKMLRLFERLALLV